MKAKKWLDDHHIDYIERHIKEENPSAIELQT
jgi:arsC family protein